MKKQIKDQIEKMVKAFNEENERRGIQSRYGVESNSYKRGKYSIRITFNHTFFSCDFERLFECITENNLIFFMSHYSSETILNLQ